LAEFPVKRLPVRAPAFVAIKPDAVVVPMIVGMCSRSTGSMTSLGKGA
jgi:hypothetical protein